jgi:hypothetical protein
LREAKSEIGQKSLNRFGAKPYRAFGRRAPLCAKRSAPFGVLPPSFVPHIKTVTFRTVFPLQDGETTSALTPARSP